MDSNQGAESENPKFPRSLTAQILSNSFTKTETGLSISAVDAASEYIRVFIQEAVHRSISAHREKTLNKIEQEKKDNFIGENMLDKDDINAVCGHLVVDFS